MLWFVGRCRRIPMNGITICDTPFSNISLKLYRYCTDFLVVLVCFLPTISFASSLSNARENTNRD